MSRATWSQHYQRPWEERAGDPRLPAWLRVAALAYGKHAANGHAVFRPGHIGLVLTSVDRVTGELTPMDKNNVQRAIRKAVEFGWLAEGSGSTCLVVPSHAVVGGMGWANKECPQHTRKRRVGQKVTHSDPAGRSPDAYLVGHQMPTGEALTSADASRPSISSLHVSDPDRQGVA